MHAWRGLGALLSLVVAGCSTLPGEPVTPQLAYQAAISDAAVVAPRKIQPLLPLPDGDTVRVVSWMSERKIPCAAGALPCAVTLADAPLWVTLSGEVQAKCRAWGLQGDALRRRLEQLLGLPPDPPLPYRMSTFVEFRVARERIERPCLGVAVLGVQPVCTLRAQPATAADLRAFVGQQMADSYVIDSPQGPGYPYTRLGYTYDWAPTASAGHYGASEFIVKPQSTVDAVAAQTSDDYCRAR